MFFFKDQLGNSPRKTLVVAEVGNVHDGSLGNCHAFIDAVAQAGADAVKFQCHLECESTAVEQFPARFSFHPQDRSRTAYWRRMSFERHEWMDLSAHAHARRLEFIVSPFSTQAVTLCNNLVDRWKVASGEMDNAALLFAIRDTNVPVVLSTGMAANADEIHRAIGWLSRMQDRLDATQDDSFRRDQITVLQCTTEYPTPLEHVGLNYVNVWSHNLIVQGGLSDHSGTIWPSIAAAAIGAHMVEVHVCWDKRQFGCDVSSSVTIDELRKLVEGVRAMNVLWNNPVEKEKLTPALADVAVYREGKLRDNVDLYAEFRRD